MKQDNENTHCFDVIDVTFMKTDQELTVKQILKLEHYPEALHEIDNALLNNARMKEKN